MQKFYMFVFRDRSRNVISIESFRDWSLDQARMQAEVYGWRIGAAYVTHYHNR